MSDKSSHRRLPSDLVTQPQKQAPTSANTPTTTTKSKKLSVRVSERGWQTICKRAATSDVTPSHMVRRMLTYAAEHMPATYTPGMARTQPAAPPDSRRGREPGRR